MAALAAALALGYAVVDAFSAWALGRRRRRLAMTFMAGAVLLVIAGVAAAFAHRAAFPLALAGAATSVVASFAERRGTRNPTEWVMPRPLRLIGAVAVVAVTALAQPPLT
jgi:hypothetical protein